MTRRWAREYDDEGPWETALPALERRDAIIGSWSNDGISRGTRIVDEDGNVIEYGSRVTN